MTPEEKASQVIEAKLRQSGWVIQDFAKVNLTVSLGVAVREFPASTGPVDYTLFIDGAPVGVVEAKRDDMGKTSPLLRNNPAAMRTVLQVCSRHTPYSVCL